MKRLVHIPAILLWTLLITAASASHANVPGGGSGGPSVTLAQDGRRVTLANGIVTATIDTAGAAVLSMRYRGHEMISTAGRHTRIYFSMSGGTSYEQPAHCVYSITKQQPDLVDISCKRIYSPGDKQPWDIDVHYALRSGNSGLYVYAVVSHAASYPNAGMGEWRMVWSMPEEGGKALLDHIYVDDLRHWQMPSSYDFAHAQPTGIKEIVKLTTGPWAGKYDCKYMYTADLWKEDAYGHASGTNHLGAWVVFGGHDYFNDGPTKNDLTSAAGLIHIMLYAEHYNGKGFTIPHGQTWSKIYGPWLLYLNNKMTGDANWADAKAQAQAEESAWPYSWLASRDYPSEAKRGAVTGRLVVRDSLKSALNGAGAWVGLAQPEAQDGNWQFQGDAYQYWVRADANGRFTIPHVRPGAYTLYAFTTGAVGEFSRTGVDVRAGTSIPLGTVTWNVPHPGKHIAWEIGVPDRTAAEFRHGKDYFEPYLFTEFPQELPNPLEYDVTKNNWAAAWNYAQTTYTTGAANVPWRWRIHFPLAAAPSGDATLTLAFASSDQTRLHVFVNDESTPLTTVTPPNAGGNALIREAIHGKYGLSFVRIPASRLKAGANMITLEQASVHGGFSHIMYDYLNLELP